MKLCSVWSCCLISPPKMAWPKVKIHKSNKKPENEQNKCLHGANKLSQRHLEKETRSPVVSTTTTSSLHLQQKLFKNSSKIIYFKTGLVVYQKFNNNYFLITKCLNLRSKKCSFSLSLFFASLKKVSLVNGRKFVDLKTSEMVVLFEALLRI